ncbi:MAG: large conductance mechanosensitive channel protein MscL [Lachnospiraceae bacterium]|nr:large conductance mechanosensitive channel protein MscL [Lachnospiraceae bacterium]
MKNFWTEFKAFISKGSVMDMAVGIIIGGGFTAIVNSLVNDLVMPLLSLLTGGYDFTKLSVVLGSGDNAATLNYGLFISAVINFLLIAFVIFCLIKALNKMKDKVAKKEEEAPTTKKCPFCKSEIDIEATRCPHCTSELDK